MTPLYPNEAQARRYLDYWRVMKAQKRGTACTKAAEVAYEYLSHLPLDIAESLRLDFNFNL